MNSKTTKQTNNTTYNTQFKKGLMIKGKDQFKITTCLNLQKGKGIKIAKVKELDNFQSQKSYKQLNHDTTTFHYSTVFNSFVPTYTGFGVLLNN